MTDYGHELAFGTFVTPTAQQPENPVALAQLSEQSGLDLVTFQDHPYQPSFLDTWTLLSFVAARTERIHLSANVLNLPLRQPAVLARSAASLDLLSGGRVSFGLGSGAFWDAIEAMGGQRLSPGEAVTALGEAIAIIRGIWDADNRDVLRVDGRFHSVNGAKRGPAAAHDIPIWLGAYKPRMLRLIGTSADGWLPSLGYLPSLDALDEGNAVIDEAALAAGRNPETIRRLLNIGGKDLDPERLAEIAVERGIATFILGTDDANVIRHFGQEVAPAVRDLVEAERAGRASEASAGGLATALVREQLAAAGATASAGGRATASSVAGPGALPEALGIVPTADDGTRLSTASLWNEAERPSAPPVPEGTSYTARGRAIGQHLVDVHDHLRTELAEVRDVIVQVRDGAMDVGSARSAINAMTMRQNEWTLGAYCAAYCRTVTTHHTIEDEGFFRHLREADSGLVPVVDRLQEEHVVIHEVLEDVDRALVEFVTHPEDFSGLQEAVDVLTDTLLSHLSYEERELVEPLARYGMAPGQL